ncbi:hypothetical protein F2Q69_00063346, partial [Brassica cretica]
NDRVIEVESKPQADGEWSTGFCDCFSDCSNCKLFFPIFNKSKTMRTIAKLFSTIYMYDPDIVSRIYRFIRWHGNVERQNGGVAMGAPVVQGGMMR